MIISRKLLIFCLIALTGNSAYSMQTEQGSAVTIERYQANRDKNCLKIILRDFASELLANPTQEDQQAALQQLENHANTYVLRVDNKTVGFIHYYTIDDTFFTFHLGRKGIINGIGIVKEYQNKGYGKLLLNFALQKLQELHVPTVYLQVKTDNKNAMKFYKKQNFQFYQDVSDGQVLKRLLDVNPEHIPKGNLIQQYPKISLAFAYCVVMALCMYSLYDSHTITSLLQ